MPPHLMTFQSSAFASYDWTILPVESTHVMSWSRYRFSIEKRYRLHDITWVDSTGKIVQSYEANAEDWKVIKWGGMMQRLFDAVGRLPPFGEWKVVDYRFGDGTPTDAQQ